MIGPIQRATTVQDALWACELTPLPGGDKRWVDLKESRGADVQERFKRLLIKPASVRDTFSHITFAGHRGCGKSTELLQVSDTLRQNRFFIVYSQTNEDLDITDITYADLLLAASKVLVEYVGKEFSLDEKLLEHLTAWFAETTEIDTETVKKEIELQTSAEAGAQIPFLAKFLAKITALIKGTDEHRQEIRRKVLKSPDQLIFHVNQLLDECYRAIRASGQYNELLLIFDNLDRYQPDTVHKVLIEQADNLKRLRCNVIYTVPISLMYEPKREPISDVFDTVVLPMSKIRQKEQSWDEVYAEGINSLIEVIDRRVATEQVFASPALVKRFALQSGGSLRELMRLVREACLATEADKIDEVAVERAIVNVRGEFVRPMQQGFLAELARIHQTKQTENSPTQRNILFYRYALEYNADLWVDVHPLLYDLPEFQQELRKLSRGRKTRAKKATT